MIMKRYVWTMMVTLLMGITGSQAAMSNSRLRRETRFLTDKMAFELKLSTEQYNDVYEINYDFMDEARYLMADVLRGEEWAMERYYDLLDVRNDDLRWVLGSSQYGRFLRTDYFYRPLYANGGNWSFRVYIHYTNHNHFYYPKPYHYRTYCGGHGRPHHPHASFYKGRYNQPHYTGRWQIREDKAYHAARRSDFGSVPVRRTDTVRPKDNNRTSHRGTAAAPADRPMQKQPSRQGTSVSRPARAKSNATSRSSSSEVKRTERAKSEDSAVRRSIKN